MVENQDRWCSETEHVAQDYGASTPDVSADVEGRFPRRTAAHHLEARTGQPRYAPSEGSDGFGTLTPRSHRHRPSLPIASSGHRPTGGGQAMASQAGDHQIHSATGQSARCQVLR